MKIKELAEYCKSIDIDCENCKYHELCNQKLPWRLEDISPYGLVELVESNEEL